jgi:hypothetical protein
MASRTGASQGVDGTWLRHHGRLLSCVSIVIDNDKSDPAKVNPHVTVSTLTCPSSTFWQLADKAFTQPCLAILLMITDTFIIVFISNVITIPEDSRFYVL